MDFNHFLFFFFFHNVFTSPSHMNGPKYPWPNRTQRSISFSVFVATRLVSETDAWPPVCRPSTRRGAPSAGEEPSARLPPFLLPSWTTLRHQTRSAAAKIQRRRPLVSALAIGLVLLVAMAVILVVTRRELEHETDGFSESNVVGWGAYGAVYRERLTDGTAAAIKRLRLVHRQQGSISSTSR